MLAITIWCFAALFEAAFKDLGLKIIFSKISYAGIVAAPVFFLFFISRYSNLDSWITRRSKVFLFLLPAATFIMAVTNELHMLIWTDIYLKYNSIAGTFAFYKHGPWYWGNSNPAACATGARRLIWSTTRGIASLA